MNMRTHARILCLAFLCLALFTTAGYLRVHAASHSKGLKASDPQLSGPRDMNYDHTIVPGQRIGPVRIGGLVSEAVQHLGNPDVVVRAAEFVFYGYKQECIRFRWEDRGAEPIIVDAFVDCNKWSTSSGLQVGSSMHDVTAQLGTYCARTAPNRSMTIESDGIAMIFPRGRNSSANQVSISVGFRSVCN